MTIVVLTVGGSHQPILATLLALKPDRVAFLCSADIPTLKGSWTQVAGEGKVIRSKPDLAPPDLPNIVTLAGLAPDRYEIVRIEDFDHLEACYREASAVLERLHQQWPEARVFADYTGGTKSMAAGLAIAAVDDEGCEVYLVTGIRADLDRVRDRMEFAQPVAVWDIRARRRLKEVAERVSRFDYAGAASLLEAIGLTPLSRELRETVAAHLAICRGLDAWDRFAHAEARELLAPFRRHLVAECVALDELCRREPRDPYVRVEDLLFNAERRAEQRRYDDAVARAYRALELIAQTRLRAQHGIDTADVDPARVPFDGRAGLEQYRDSRGKIRLALVQGWELLGVLSDEPLGAWFHSRKAEVLGLLESRNRSILAHGTEPIDGGAFASRGRRMLDLCREALAHPPGRRSVAIQFPRALAQMPALAGREPDDGVRRGVLSAPDASAIADFAARVRGALGGDVLDMRLFGSKATGRDVPGSDIDILVVVRAASVGVEDQVLAIAFDVNLAHDVYISPRVIARATLDDPVWRITPFVQAALAGVPV